MACRPASQESLEALRRLQVEAAGRDDDCLSLLLAGVELYIRAGRDFELLEHMRTSAEDLRDAIENTPSAEDLRRLFETE